MDRRRATGIALVLISAAAFGSGSLFAQPVYGAGVDWLTLSAWRFLFGAGLTWCFLLLSSDRRLGLRRMDRRAIVAAVGLGVLYVGNSGTYYASLETVSPSLAALVVYLYPAIVAVLSLRFGHRLRGRRAWLALAISLAGVVLAVGGIDPDDSPPLSGLLLAFASCFIYAVWVVLAARLSGERREAVAADAVDAGDAGSVTATVALIMTATATVYWVSALGTGRPVLPGEIPSEAWVGLVGVGVGATFIAIQTFYAGARRVGAAHAALISTAEPIWTIALAAILFSVALTPVQLVGGALILIGVVVAQTGPAAERAPALRVRVADE
jgi:drug/metabolite transporter (DMT)-like permease